MKKTAAVVVVVPDAVLCVLDQDEPIILFFMRERKDLFLFVDRAEKRRVSRAWTGERKEGDGESAAFEEVKKKKNSSSAG